MNIKVVALTSLLVGTAIATETTKKQPTQELADLIEAEYSQKKDTAHDWRHDMAHHFDYSVMPGEPFCSLSKRDLTEEAFDSHVKALRPKFDGDTKAAVAFKNVQLNEKISHIMEHLKDVEEMVLKLIKTAEQDENGNLHQRFKEQMLAFKIGLATYEPKSKNFKEIRSAMDSLKGIFHFNLKSDEFIRIVVNGLKGKDFERSAKKLGEALEKAGIKVTDSDYPACLEKVMAVEFPKTEEGKNEKAKFRKAITNPFILSALKNAHNKTSSSVVLGTFVTASILLAFALLALKHMNLVKKEREEFTD